MRRRETRPTRAFVGIMVAAAMIAGWLLQVAAAWLPDDWHSVAVLVGILAFSVLVEILDRRIDKAIADRDDA